MKTYSGLDLRSFVNIKPRSVFLVIPVIGSEEEVVSRTLMLSRNRKAVLDYPKISRVGLQ